MAKELFTEAQNAAARDLGQKLDEQWRAEPDNGARLLAASYFLATAVAAMMPNRTNADKLIQSIAAQAGASIGDIPGWPESFHGKQN